MRSSASCGTFSQELLRIIRIFLMDKSISFYDAGAESFYHGVTLGLEALTQIDAKRYDWHR